MRKNFSNSRSQLSKEKPSSRLLPLRLSRNLPNRPPKSLPSRLLRKPQNPRARTKSSLRSKLQRPSSLSPKTKTMRMISTRSTSTERKSRKMMKIWTMIWMMTRTKKIQIQTSKSMMMLKPPHRSR